MKVGFEDTEISKLLQGERSSHNLEPAAVSRLRKTVQAAQAAREISDLENLRSLKLSVKPDSRHCTFGLYDGWSVAAVIIEQDNTPVLTFLSLSRNAHDTNN